MPTYCAGLEFSLPGTIGNSYYQEDGKLYMSGASTVSPSNSVDANITNTHWNKLYFAVDMESTVGTVDSDVKVLIQIYRKDGTTITSLYKNIPNGTVGAYQLYEHDISQEDKSQLDYVKVNLVTSANGSAVFNNVYAGGVPMAGAGHFIGHNKIDMLRHSVYDNLLDMYPSRPEPGVLTQDGDIVIQAGQDIYIDLSFDDVESVYYSAMIEQVTGMDLQVSYTFYKTSGGSGNKTENYLSKNGELNTKISTDDTINQISARFKNNGTQALKVKNLIISTSEVYQPAAGVNYNVRKPLSKLIDDRVINLSENSDLRFIQTPKNQSIWRDKYLKVGPSGSVQVLICLDGSRFPIEDGKEYYLTFKDLVVTGSVSINLTDQSSGYTEVLHEDVPAYSMKFPDNLGRTQLKLTIHATDAASSIEFSGFYVSETPVLNDNQTIVETFNRDELKGKTVRNEWFNPALTAYTVSGDPDAVYTITTNEDGKNELTIPTSNSGVQYGQSARYRFNYQSYAVGKPRHLSLLAKTDGSGDIFSVFLLYYTADSTTLGAKLIQVPLKDGAEWTEVQVELETESSGQTVGGATIGFNVADNTSPVTIKQVRLTAEYTPTDVSESVDIAAISGTSTEFDSLTDAIVAQPKGIFNVGNMQFKQNKDNPSSASDYDLVNGGEICQSSTLNDVAAVNPLAYRLLVIDSSNVMWFKKKNTSELYSVPTEAFFATLIAQASVGGEKRYLIDESALTLVSSSFTVSTARQVGNGSLVGVSNTQAIYSSDGNVTFQEATFPAMEGGMLDGWLFDAYDNVVVTGSYYSAGRGKGHINYSSDYGQTYKTILNVATTPFLGETERASTHIHGVCYDKFWKRVWVVFGDYSLDTAELVDSKIAWCDNPDDASPVWTFESRAKRFGQQHVSVMAMKDCILLGSDQNPSYVGRRARTQKDKSAEADVALYLHNELAYYVGGMWQHSSRQPATIFAAADRMADVPDCVDQIILTKDGFNFDVVWSDTRANSGTSGKTNNRSYAVDNNRLVCFKDQDPRFVDSDYALIVGRLQNYR